MFPGALLAFLSNETTCKAELITIISDLPSLFISPVTYDRNHIKSGFEVIAKSTFAAKFIFSPLLLIFLNIETMPFGSRKFVTAGLFCRLRRNLPM
jgi:hypothetical protein